MGNLSYRLSILAYLCANKSPIGLWWIPLESSGVQWTPIGIRGEGKALQAGCMLEVEQRI